MVRWVWRLRSAYHPVHWLRKHRAFRDISRRLDVPVWASLYGINWKVRLLLIRNSSYLLNKRSNEPEILALFIAIMKLLRPASFWDIGANIGVYSWLVKSYDPTVRVLMFEPDPINVKLIRETMDRSQLSGVELYARAISDTSGHKPFCLDAITGATGTLETPSDSFVVRQFNFEPQCVDVETMALDDVQALEGKVDLIKIDVEGHEASVLRGGRNTLIDSEPVLIFESFSDQERLTSDLRLIGYSILDAERMVGQLDHATNFLGVPRRYTSRIDELRIAWLEAYHALQL